LKEVNKNYYFETNREKLKQISLKKYLLKNQTC